MTNSLAIVSTPSATIADPMIANVSQPLSVIVPALMAIAMGTSRDAAFALDLLVAVRKGKVSEKQGFHVDRLVNAHLNPMPAITCGRVIGAYKALPAGMKRFPKVRALIDETVVTIAYTAPTSDKAKPENRGTCAVSSGTWGTPDAKYYGRILADGTFVPGHNLTPAVHAWLASFANPETEVVWQY